MAPEGRPPLLIEFVQARITLLEPCAEGGGTIFTIAVACVLIANMPESQSRVLMVTLGQAAGDLLGKATIDGRGRAIAGAPTVVTTLSRLIHAQHIGIA